MFFTKSQRGFKILILLIIVVILLIENSIAGPVCSQVCLECVNPLQISILQKGSCIKQCDSSSFSSLLSPCYQFSPNSITVNNITITYKNINQYIQRPLVFENIQQLSIYNIIIYNVTISRQQQSTIPFLFGINNVYRVSINNFVINQSQNLPTIIRAQSIFNIFYLQLMKITYSSFYAVQNAFQIINGNILQISQISAENVSLNILKNDVTEENQYYQQMQSSNVLYTNWIPPKHLALFQSNSVKYVSIEQAYFNKNYRISLLECYNYYFNNQQQSLIQTSISNVTLTQIQAYQNLQANIYIGQTQQLNVIRSTFANNICQNCQGTAIYTNGTSSLQIIQSLFINNTAQDGGSVYIKNSKCSQVPATCNQISSSEFTLNQAIASGGALMLDNSDIHFLTGKIGNLFYENSALIGGAIRYINYVPYYFQRYAEQKLFNINYNDNKLALVVFNNQAMLFGRNIGSYPRDFKIDYDNPKEITHDKFENMNKLLLFQNSSLLRSFEIKNIRSGQTLPLQVIFLDEENFPVYLSINKTLPASIRTEIDPFYVTAYNLNNITAIDGDYHKRSNSITNGLIQFDNLQVYARPGTSTMISLITNIIKIPQADHSYDNTKTFDMSIKIKMRLCKQGEIYSLYNNQTIYYCQPCGFGEYSLVFPKLDNSVQVCQLCPKSSAGCMENLIILQNGFWRKDENSDQIFDCYNNQGNCLGQIKDNSQLCKEGHIGPLCETCDLSGKHWGQRYVQGNGYDCQPCKTQGALEIGKTIFFVVFIFCYSYIGMYTTQDMNYKILVADYLRKFEMLSISKSAIQDETPFYIKACTIYLQIYSAINKINVDLIQTAMQTPSVIAFPIESLKNVLDCNIAPFLEKQNYPMSFIKMIYGPYFSFFFTLLFAIVEFFKCQIEQKQHMTIYQSLMHGVIYYQIFFLPSNIKNFFSGLFCRQVGTDNYVQSDLLISCYTFEYWQNVLLLIINNGLFIFFIFSYTFLDMRSSNRQVTSIRLAYGFLFVGYKPKYYYWEFVKIFFRSFIIVLVCSSSYEGSTFINTAIIILLALIALFVLTQFMKPHDRDKFNQLENKSTFFLILILIFNIFIKNSQNEQMESIGKIVIAVIHCSFFSYMILIIILTKIQAKNGVEYNGFIGYLKRKFPKLFNQVQFDTLDKSRVSKNWKKLIEIYAYKNEQKKSSNCMKRTFFGSINKKLQRRRTLYFDQLQSLQNFQRSLGILSQGNNNSFQQSSYSSNDKNLKQIQQNINMPNQTEAYQNQIKLQKILTEKQESTFSKQQCNSNTQREQSSNQTSFAQESPKSYINSFQKALYSNLQKQDSITNFGQISINLNQKQDQQDDKDRQD
ncbi:transmembrane protein, putative (macronuclear) [Tetrahymena thermophila SB210]|uniref:Transmembrane protein, putative n=1 Tax=Tetrahymena thermophila (strain SB210) TaxID=312017 RepID=Q22LU9_TETTS|nr:transmembrane protein, putative [Tetrahymena thermophila SB210]EAR86521.3 transmembrane protein, putative [Tetrahymena thermophila SB210]|eukprot:XP_977271.3 transmembrane protein, putative [Tetrahymena thermophila SB210]